MAVEIDIRSDVRAEIVEEFRRRTQRSAELQTAAQRVLPGGDTRTIAYHQPYPLSIAEGHGCRLVDADGNEYADFLNNYTSLIHGHAHPAITQAVAAQLPNGTAFPARHPAQTRLAEIITGRVASVDLVRFCNSGTEAVMNAIRAARAFTNRELIVKIEGGYHGTYDDVEISVHPDPTAGTAGDAAAPLAVLDTRGVPRDALERVLVVPYNDIGRMERVLRELGDDVAAVILEPVLGAGGMIPAEVAFVEAVRARTIECGAVLIFDEVMSFRLAPGGFQEHLRVRPDLTTFAKIIGGGFPVGAFGGRAAIMEQFDPSRPDALSQSGTFNGNAITMVAGVAAMEHYTAGEVRRINDLGNRLRRGLAAALETARAAGTVTGYGSFIGVHLTAGPVRDYRSAASANRDDHRLLHLALLLEGIFCAPRLMWCTSTAMDETVIDDAVAAFERSLARVQPALSL